MAQTRSRTRIHIRISRCFLAAAVLFLLFLAIPPGEAAKAASPSDCGEAFVVAIRDGSPALRLPAQAGGTFTVYPDDELLLRAENVPSAGSVDASVGMPFVDGIPLSFEWDTPGPSQSFEVPIVAAEYTRYTRGAYDVTAVLRDAGGKRCDLSFTLVLAGFGAVVPVAAAAGAAASGVAVAGATAWSVSGARLKLEFQVAVQKRKRRGLRRWLPVPAWRRTVTATVTGAITGLLTALVFQQAGAITLTTGAVISGPLIGGGVSFGVGVVWSSVLAFVREPAEPEVTDNDENAGPG